MKKIKNERGFTLIELLAVIVVLAIVLLMGAMAVIPRMNEARKQVFALEANQAIQAASTYLMNNALKPGSGKPTYPVKDEVKCVTINDLIESGDFDADKDKYLGRVLIKRLNTTSNIYLYKISMTNKTVMVVNEGVSGDSNKDITADNVVDYNNTSDTWSYNSCPAEAADVTAAWSEKASS